MSRLCIDWGNSRVKAAIFDDAGAITAQSSHTEGEAPEAISQLLDRHQPDASILCSVADHPQEAEALLREKTRFVRLDGNTMLPIVNAYTSRETLGGDRLAMVVAAHSEQPEKNNLVIGIGTCITYNLVLKNRTFRGGAISPGMHMRLYAMHHFTDKLPEVSVDGDLRLLGYDTETCMRSGAVYGMMAEIEGMAKAYSEEYPDFNAVLTGGDAPFFARQLKNRIFADPDLTLRGLYLILKHNVPIFR